MAVPIDKVVQMKQQGLSNNQILEALQREGIKTDEIYDAIKQGDVKIQMQQQNIQQPQFSSQPMTPQMPTSQVPTREEIEEIAESIIEEKWEDISDEIKKVAEWRDTVEKRIHSLEANFSALKDNFDRLHSALLEKIDEYDRHISEVGIDIKALEKVFQKVLPTFTQNVNELSRISKDLKQVKK